MKTFSKKLIAAFVLICMLLTIATPVNISAAEIALNKTNLSMRVKQTYQLKVTGTTKKVTWSSSDSKIATVTSEGKVKGIKTGTATIKAKVSGKTYSAKVKVVSALSAKDFIVDFKIYPEKTDFISESINEESKVFWGLDVVFTANRGIKNGSSASAVEKSFGIATYKKYSSSEAINKVMKENGVDDSKLKQYLEYKFTTQGVEYRLRFYLNNSKKVNGIVLIKNYAGFNNTVASIVKLKFASEEKNGELRTEIIDGNTVTIIPYGDSFSLLNEVKAAFEFVINFYDEEGNHVAGRDQMSMLEFGENYKFDELEYWYVLGESGYYDFKDLNLSEYKYFSIDIWNPDGETKDAPQGSVTYYFRFE